VAAQVQAGAADPLDLLNSQIELSTSKLLQLDSRVKFHQAFAALEDAIQRPLDSIQPPLFEQSQRPQAMKGNQP
jgi:outer membrane protein TolC